jgi:uncharacterized protein (TIGR00299 family) protein
MTRLAYLDCHGGIAGDMVLGALLDAGAPRTALDHVVEACDLADITIETERVLRGGIAATQVRVVVPSSHDTPPGRPVGRLLEMVAGAALPERVRARTTDALRRLAAVEGEIHGAPPEDVILHELGGVDTVVDLCGAFMLVEALGIDRVVCSPLPYARGSATTAHGTIPTPGPAVLALLRGAPLVGVGTREELVTPTGAAVATALAEDWGELPAMTLEGVGYGAGERDLPDRANVLRVVLGTTVLSTASPPVVLLEANLDDLLPELVPDALQRCTAAGAFDVWTVSAQMKKGRPGIVVGALARADDERAVAAALLEHTSTLGVRVTPVRRYELDREIREVRVDGYAIRVKIGLLEGRVVNVAPEHDDCASVAALSGLPVKRVWAAALAAAQEIIEPSRGNLGTPG